MPTTHPTPLLLAPFALAALGAAAPPTGLSMEGHTGYLVTPSARVVPEGTVVIAYNRHLNDTIYNEPKNILAAFGPLPYTEIVCRFSYPDLGANAKVGALLYERGPFGIWAGAGRQDLWGGANLYRADYAVLTGTAGPLELSLGWGNGDVRSAKEAYGGLNIIHNGHRRMIDARLEGLFHGASLQILPSSWPLQASLLEDMDGNTWRAGGRMAFTYENWRLQGMIATRFDSLGTAPEFQFEAHWTLPDTGNAAPPPPWKVSPVVVQFSPWLQTFVGTEHGDFDAQAALNSELHLALDERWFAATRVRTRIVETRNLEEGRPFHSNLQQPRTWWESGALGILLGSPPNDGSLLTQGGWIDGDRIGAATRLESPPFAGITIAMAGGAWYSPGWDEYRSSYIPALRWNSPRRNWFGQVDMGRYWNQDNSARIRFGRRWGPLSGTLGLFRVFDTEETLVEGRLSWSFSGRGIGNEWFQVRPSPVWAHGLRTKVASHGNNLNALRMNPAVEPPLLLQIPN